MTKFGFIVANLFRKKARTLLTLLSIVMAFLLFGLLQSVNAMFTSGADFVGATRLITQSRVSFTQSLPIKMRAQLDAIPGVAAVSQQQWFGGVWQENTQVFTFVVDPVRWHDVYPEWVMPEEQWQAFANVRASMIAGRVLADAHGWQIGQTIPLKSDIFPLKSDGTKNWAFELVGIYDGKDEEWQRNTNMVYLNYDYFDEASQFGSGLAGIFVLRLDDPDMAQQVAAQIDRMTENSADETKTQTEKDWNIGFVKQFGDIGMIVRWILFAVFFTLLLVVGNTMAQSVRERIPELAVLKTLGFSDGSVLGFVLAETLILCALGGVIGLALATGLGYLIQKGAGGMMPISVDGGIWALGLVAIVLLSIVVGLLPALRAQRLKIVDALAGR